MRLVVEPCMLCHVRIVCLGVVRHGIYILRDNMCMRGAMRRWYFLVSILMFSRIYQCVTCHSGVDQ